MRWIFADDLTGAMEVAVIGPEPTLVAWQPGSLGSRQSVVVNLATRDLDCSRLDDSMARWGEIGEEAKATDVGQKMDSLGRGHWPHETRWLAEHFNRSRVLVAPSLPAEERSVKEGWIWYRKQKVLDLRQSLASVGLSVASFTEEGSLPKDLGTSVTVFVADASTDEDLRHLVRTWPFEARESLFVGSRGLLSAWISPTPGGREIPNVDGPILVIIGSLHAERLGQLSALKTVLPIWSLSELARGAQLPCGQDGVVTSVDMEADGPGVIQAYWQSVLPKVLRRGWGALLVSGGATAEVVLASAQAGSVEALAALPEGSALGRINGGMLHGTLIATKSGSFGTESALAALYNGLVSRRNEDTENGAKTRN
ncbi:MAG: hypothetical protein M1600_04470 [Firmicutes bacterium]|nr:hypothetical protein [Bacillota bacterium]